MRYYDYWNDVEIQKTDPLWIEDVSDTKLIHYLREETNLERCFLDAVSFAKDLGCMKGCALDIGAGVGWSSAIISKMPLVQTVTATDFSKHRLTKICPIVFKQFGGNYNKLTIRLGNFLHLEWKPQSFDIVIFVQSLYMFSDITRVLNKVNRLLVPGGLLIVGCERISPEYPIFSTKFFKRNLKWLLRGRADTSGNRYFIDSEYRKAIKGAGFDYKFQLLDYSVYPKDMMLNAGNHFGIKPTAV